MRSIIVCLSLIVIIFIIEALYCRIARKHQVISREHEEKNNEIKKYKKIYLEKLFLLYTALWEILRFCYLR